MRPLSRRRMIGYALARLGPDADVRRLEVIAGRLWPESVAYAGAAADADLLDALAEGARRELHAAACEQRSQGPARRRGR
jgi:hypothetical protein